MHRLTTNKSQRQTRRGLAMVEFVLSLPILLFVMALMINFGNMASWKVRTATAARQAVWRQKYDRRGGSDPRIPDWPSTTNNTASMSVSSGQSLFADPFTQHTVVRGPSIMADTSGASLRVNDQLDVTLGVQNGRASITVKPPLLPAMEKYQFNVQHPLLDTQSHADGSGNGSKWQFQRMGIPYNAWRRIPFIYPELQPKTFFYNLLQNTPQGNKYFQAVTALMTASFKSALNPLDRDDEFISYYSPRYSPPTDYRPPNFHPQVLACELDFTQVEQMFIQNPGGLLDRIRGPKQAGKGGVPDRMARAFIAMYQEQLDAIKAAGGNDPALQKKIDELNAFIGTLN